jgi:hypothetical protein
MENSDMSMSMSDPSNFYTLDVCMKLMKVAVELYESRAEKTVTMEECINRIISTNVKQHFITALNTCKCCDRHQVDRPTKYGTWIVRKVPTSQYTDCNCQCRHFARNICRTCE